MGEGSLPTRLFQFEIGVVIPGANQLSFRERAPDFFEGPEKILVPFAKSDRADTNETGRGRQGRARSENRSVHAVRIENAFGLWDPIVHHRFHYETGGTGDQIGSFKIAVG